MFHTSHITKSHTWTKNYLKLQDHVTFWGPCEGWRWVFSSVGGNIN